MPKKSLLCAQVVYKFTSYNDSNEVVDELFESLMKKYRIIKLVKTQ